MGCGSSRFDTSGLPLPIKARPSFLRRLDDIKNRKNSQILQGTTLSKKELLLHEKEDDDIHVNSGQEPRTSNARKSSYSPKENESCVTSEGLEKLRKDSADKRGNNLSGNDMSKNIDYKDENVGEKGNHHAQLRRKNSCVRARENLRVDDSANCDSENDEDDDLDERRLKQKGEELGCPGSPSFRVYFNEKDVEDNSDKAPKDNPAAMTKVDGPVSPKVESSLPQDKKQKTRRSFKKVLPRGGPAAMKNLLNVSSCMSSPHSSSHDQTRLLTPKTQA